MGENNAAFNRPLHINRDVLMAAAAIYKDMYGKVSLWTIPFYFVLRSFFFQDDQIPGTFQIIYLVAWKPSPDQPKPLPRGSGEVSLKDLSKVIEGSIKPTSKEKQDKRNDKDIKEKS